MNAGNQTQRDAQATREQHTPGPWVIDGDRDEDVFGIIPSPPRGGRICEMEQTFGYSEADEANARLIAAAPDLLAACEAAERGSRAIGATAMADILERAIMKATGGAS